jgi:putative sigma-54 modulation protein
MNLTICGHHIELTPGLRQYVIDKLARVWAHFDQVVDVSIILSMEKLRKKEQRQKIVVTARYKGKPIVVGQRDIDLYSAIDKLVDRLDRLVVRYKSKVKDRRYVAAKRLVPA